MTEINVKTPWGRRAIRDFCSILAELRRENKISKTHKYVPLAQLIQVANSVFGFDGWSSEVVETGAAVVEMTETVKDFFDKVREDGEQEEEEADLGIAVGSMKTLYSVEIESRTRIVLKDGTEIERAGKGRSERAPTRQMAFTKARKEAITNATKNCFMALESV